MKKRLFIISLLSLLLFCSVRLNANSKSDNEKQQAKKLQEMVDSINYTRATQCLTEMNFIIRADYVTFKSGRTVNTTPSTNFISAHDGNGIVQLSFPGMKGPNWIGGITVEGVYSNVKTSFDKKGNFTMEYSVMGNAISARIVAYLPKGSTKCNATVYPDFNSDTMTVSGNVISYDQSEISVGRKL